MSNLPLPFEQLYGGPMDGCTVESSEICGGMVELGIVFVEMRLPKCDTHIITWKRAPVGRNPDAFVTYERSKKDNHMRHARTHRISFK